MIKKGVVLKIIEKPNELIKKRRKELGLSIKELHEKINIDKIYLKKIENGEIELDPFLILKLHKPLNFGLKELLNKCNLNSNRIHFKKMLNNSKKRLDQINKMKRKIIGIISLNIIALVITIVLGVIRLYNKKIIWGTIFISFIVLNTYTLQKNLDIYSNIKEEENKLKFFENKINRIIENLQYEDREGIYK